MRSRARSWLLIAAGVSVAAVLVSVHMKYRTPAGADRAVRRALPPGSSREQVRRFIAASGGRAVRIAAVGGPPDERPDDPISWEVPSPWVDPLFDGRIDVRFEFAPDGRLVRHAVNAVIFS